MGRRYREPTYVRDKECPYCGYFFTPQGLSGHIRYAHKTVEGKNNAIEQLTELVVRKAEMEAFAKASGAPQGDIKEAKQWLDDWGRIITKGALLQVEFTEADFKDYIRARILGANSTLRQK
jgi:hypothetical protein